MKAYGIAVIAANLFTTNDPSKTEKDVNGNQTVAFKCVAGKMPNTMTLNNGTVCKNSGIEPGKMFAIQIDEEESKDSDSAKERIAEYGRQFRFSMLEQVSVASLLSLKKDLGEPQVETVAEGRKAEPAEVTAKREGLRQASKERRQLLDQKFGLKATREANL